MLRRARKMVHPASVRVGIMSLWLRPSSERSEMIASRTEGSEMLDPSATTRSKMVLLRPSTTPIERARRIGGWCIGVTTAGQRLNLVCFGWCDRDRVAVNRHVVASLVLSLLELYLASRRADAPTVSRAYGSR